MRGDTWYLPPSGDTSHIESIGVLVLSFIASSLNVVGLFRPV